MKLKPYPEYKDSGIQWIGEIPEGWEVHKIKRFSRIETGNTPPKEDEKYYENGDFPWIRPDELKGFYPILDSNIKLNKEGKLHARNIPKNSILVCCIGSIGKIGIAGKELATNQQINSIVLNEKICTFQYGKYIIFDSKSEMEGIGNANVVSILNKSQQGEISYCIPPLQEQIAIASFLDKKTTKIDILIENDKILIKLLKEKRIALINHSVTKGLPVRVRTQTGLNPQVKLKYSGIDWIGEIPEGWKVHRLKFKETVTMGQSPDSERYNYEYKGYPFLQGNAEFSDVHPNPSIWCDAANKYALKNDILLSVRAPIGAINIADQKYSIGRGLCAIRIKTNNLKYIFYQLLTCVDYLNSIGTGSTYSAISTEDISNLPMRYPPPHEQTAIANFLDKSTTRIDKTIRKIERKINFLQEYKKSLIHHTVTGKVDVREIKA
jgi:type I restriction enzyme S subunit